MALNSSEIARRLRVAPSNQKDNEAQNIINGASDIELKNLNVEGVLRLYEALAMLPPRIFSANDKAALTRLRKYTQFQPVSNNLDLAIKLIKSTRPSPFLSELTPGLVTRIYVSEEKRLSLAERIGIDGATIGRGQLGQSAYADVIKPSNFQDVFKTYINQLLIPELLKSEHSLGYHKYWKFNIYTTNIEASYSDVYRNQKLEDFVVAAYLAIRIHAAIRPGRSGKDTARFAVALYHGMRQMVVSAQNATKDTTNWAPIEAELNSQGHRDAANYVSEIVK